MQNQRTKNQQCFYTIKKIWKKVKKIIQFTIYKNKICRDKILKFTWERWMYGGRERRRKREWKRALPSDGLFHKYLQWQRVSQVRARSQELNPGLPHGSRKPIAWWISDACINRMLKSGAGAGYQSQVPDMEYRLLNF